MSRLPRISGKEVISALKKMEFEVIRIKGSHHFLKHSDGRATVVPVHSNEIIGPGLINKILKECDILRDDFVKIL
jgi:predicted RNA binding protein YcfA (HicA-like mRNA interferase family)